MLTRFRSASSRPTTLAFLAVGLFLLAIQPTFVSPATARMDSPQHAPDLEGWPDPDDEHVTNGSNEPELLGQEASSRSSCQRSTVITSHLSDLPSGAEMTAYELLVSVLLWIDAWR